MGVWCFGATYLHNDLLGRIFFSISLSLSLFLSLTLTHSLHRAHTHTHTHTHTLFPPIIWDIVGILSLVKRLDASNTIGTNIIQKTCPWHFPILYRYSRMRMTFFFQNKYICHQQRQGDPAIWCLEKAKHRNDRNCPRVIADNGPRLLHVYIKTKSVLVTATDGGPDHWVTVQVVCIALFWALG